MTKLEQLIEELCPDGVEYVQLLEVLDYEQPTKYIVENTNYDDNYAMPVLTAGQTFILGYTNEEVGIYSANTENPAIIFDDFTTSFHWVDFNFKVKSSAMKILTVKDKTVVIFRYIYHAMRCITYAPQNHARQWIGTYSNFPIPLPPLPVQEEIVRILDKFTLLEAELTAELTAREKQYEHYRDGLLNFGDESIYKTLEEIFDIRNGYTPSKSNPKFWNNGTVPWFRMEDLRKNGSILSDSIQHITQEAVRGKLFPANSIIMATTATIGEHALLIADSLANQQFTFLSRKVNYIKIINPMFAYYYCFRLAAWCKGNTNVSSFPSVDMNRFRKFPFPIPPLAEQARIVAILDRFDTLVNDISKGLPAEIEARRKQYEYYRNMLLSFPKEEVEE